MNPLGSTPVRHDRANGAPAGTTIEAARPPIRSSSAGHEDHLAPGVGTEHHLPNAYAHAGHRHEVSRSARHRSSRAELYGPDQALAEQIVTTPQQVPPSRTTSTSKDLSLSLLSSATVSGNLKTMS